MGDMRTLAHPGRSIVEVMKLETTNPKYAMLRCFAGIEKAMIDQANQERYIRVHLNRCGACATLMTFIQENENSNNLITGKKIEQVWKHLTGEETDVSSFPSPCQLLPQKNVLCP